MFSINRAGICHSRHILKQDIISVRIISILQKPVFRHCLQNRELTLREKEWKKENGCRMNTLKNTIINRQMSIMPPGKWKAALQTSRFFFNWDSNLHLDMSGRNGKKGRSLKGSGINRMLPGSR